MSRKYDVEQLREAVRASLNRREVLQRLGLKAAGGNYATLNRLLLDHDIDTSHFTGRAWRRGRTFAPRRDVAEDLRENNPQGSMTLKRRLIHFGYFEPKCYNCERTTWLEQPIPLELEHKNGRHDDNRLENLTLLCPNCHALTPTYRGRNAARGLARYGDFDGAASTRVAGRAREVVKDRACQVCGEPCAAKFCSWACVHVSQRRTAHPTREELVEMVGTMSMLAIGRKYGVSDNAVRKWLKKHGLR